MLFLGTTFFGARYTADPSPTLAKDVKDIHIENGTFDQLFVSKNPDLVVEDGYDDWYYDTVLNADFDNNSIDAGNSGFSLKNTDYVAIKCREVGTFDWITIFTKKINTVDDFKIVHNDYFRKSNTNYEYMVVSVCNGIENTYVSKEITSKFDGLYICDKNNIYGTLFNMDTINSTKSVDSKTLKMLNSPYPSIVTNSVANYEEGSASGSFIKFNQDNNTLDIHGGIEYRTQLKDWLNNRKPKILKFHDGRIWLVSIVNTISDSADTNNDIRNISFDWIEIGVSSDMETLYSCGLSDVGREWWY